MALPPPQAPAAVASASRRTTLLAVVAGIVGIGAGVLIGAVAFGGDDEPPGREGAEADAAAGCQLMAGLPDEIPERLDGDDWSLDGPYVWRMQGAAGAFAAAGAEDRECRSLAEDGEAMYRALQTFDVDEANDALDALHDWCDDDLGDD